MTTAVARGMSAADLAVQKDALNRALERLVAISPVCGSCQDFELGKCAKYGEVPIAFQKAVGECPDWRYDGVPW